MSAPRARVLKPREYCYIQPVRPARVREDQNGPDDTTVFRRGRLCPDCDIRDLCPATIADCAVRGTIEGVDGPMLTVKSRDGQTTYKVKLADNVAVRGIIKAALSDIKQ